MERIWIVMGSTGEYSDRTEWPVLAFTSEADARVHIAALDVRMQQMPQDWKDNRWDYNDEIAAHMAPLDPGFSLNYSGTSYFCYEVKVAGGYAALLTDATTEIERLRLCIDPKTRCDRCDGVGRLMYGDDCPDCAAAGHRAASAHQHKETT